jgi:hypothetical protein
MLFIVMLGAIEQSVVAPKLKAGFVSLHFLVKEHTSLEPG